MQSRIQEAIGAALSGDWQTAAKINEELLKEIPSDIDALSRLAFAYIQLRKFDRAKTLYRKILSLDQYNSIAQKNLDKLQSLPAKYKETRIAQAKTVTPNLFIEEPGKTRSVILKNVAPISVLSKLHICDTVELIPKRHSIEVRDNDKTYVGALPDDITFRLLRFIKAGNQYHVCIKNIAKNSVTVFIRELKRGKRFAMQPTFPPNNREFSLSLPKELKKDRLRDHGDQNDQDTSDEE